MLHHLFRYLYMLCDYDTVVVVVVVVRGKRLIKR